MNTKSIIFTAMGIAFLGSSMCEGSMSERKSRYLKVRAQSSANAAKAAEKQAAQTNQGATQQTSGDALGSRIADGDDKQTTPTTENALLEVQKAKFDQSVQPKYRKSAQMSSVGHDSESSSEAKKPGLTISENNTVDIEAQSIDKTEVETQSIIDKTEAETHSIIDKTEIDGTPIKEKDLSRYGLNEEAQRDKYIALQKGIASRGDVLVQDYDDDWSALIGQGMTLGDLKTILAKVPKGEVVTNDEEDRLYNASPAVYKLMKVMSARPFTKDVAFAIMGNSEHKWRTTSIMKYDDLYIALQNKAQEGTLTWEDIQTANCIETDGKVLLMNALNSDEAKKRYPLALKLLEIIKARPKKK